MNSITVVDYDGLRRAALDAARRSDLTQRAIARALYVSESAISQALSESGPKREQLQIRIIRRWGGQIVERGFLIRDDHTHTEDT